MRHRTGPTLTCGRCGKPYYRKPNQVASSVYCSLACKWYVDPSPVRLSGKFAFIQVENKSRGFVGEAIVNKSDLERVLAVGKRYASWHETSHSFYARANIGNRRVALLHRVVTGAPDGMDVDHIDHDMLNCRRRNLRVCDRSQNLQNRRGAMVTSSSGIRNVSWDRARRKWSVCVKVRGKHIHLGRFDELDAAVKAAENGRRKYMTHSSECQ